MLTKDLVIRAYEAGIIKIVPLDEACGESEPTALEPVVEIGEHWFFAFGSEAESTTVSEYLANTPKEDIIDEVYSTLLDLQKDGFADEVNYYILFMEERLAAADETPGVRCPGCGEINYGLWTRYCWNCGCHLGGCKDCVHEEDDRNKDCCWYCSRNVRQINRDMNTRKSG